MKKTEEKGSYSKLRKNIEKCIAGNKNLIKEIDNLKVCSYMPKDFPHKRICRYIGAIYNNGFESYFLCEKEFWANAENYQTLNSADTNHDSANNQIHQTY